MSTRTYLSIGDVLTLLREEFPDVTISKIRFLESQGLVNPERSPSGYRKFFEHDVERLRWVLRQQREHFLPLKVIRDRLAEGNLEEGPEAKSPDAAETAAPTPTAATNGRVAEPARAGVGDGVGRHAASPASATVGTPSGPSRDDEKLTKADNEAMARILADASRRTAQLPEPARPPLRVVEDAPARLAASGRHLAEAASPSASASPAAAPAAPAAPGAAGTPLAARHAASAPSGAKRNAGDAPPAEAIGRAATNTAAAASSRTKGESSAASTPSAKATAPAPEATPPRTKASGAAPGAASATTSMVTGASLTAEELCSASGLSDVELASLQGFGLVDSIVVAGIPTFDEDALTVANLAAELRVFGIESRHLRLYKNAAEREVGLIEQVIIPLLRQRNPEARQRAIESAEQLSALGQTMRATLLRAALRRHLGG